jgi:spermidine synthase
LHRISGVDRRRAAILALFLLSGASGLIYQVVWFRLLATVFGATVPAATTVLTAFMSGLALGSWLLGGSGDRVDSPLRLYAGYELGIAVVAAAALVAMERMRPVAVLLSGVLGDGGAGLVAARFVVAFLVLLLPTTLMGATLPVLSRALVHDRQTAGVQLSALYAANTWGAAAGVLVAGFLLIRLLGLRGTVYVAVVTNLTVAVLAWLMARPGGRTRRAARRRYADSPGPAAAERVDGAEPGADRCRSATLLATFAAAGATTLAYEVLWSRALHSLLGNSTYAFAGTLVVFLAGIALGGWLVRFAIDRIAPVRLYAALQAGIAGAALLSVPVLTGAVDLRGLQAFFTAGSVSWAAELALRFGVTAAVLLVPTTLMGATFPLVARLYLSHATRVGTEVGRVYAAGTAGNIAGALLAGFLLVPLAGITRSLALVALLNAAVALSIVLFAGRPRRAVRLALSGGYLGLGAAAAAALAAPVSFQFPADTQAAGDVVLFYREGITATTKVYEKPLTARKHMSVDGIYIGGAGGAEKKEQALAHLPKLLLPRFRTELAVGLGSGVVPGESGRHASVEHIDIVEIAASVATGATWFERENHAILADPRVRLMVTDGLHYLATGTARYDIIASDAKSRPKSRGNGLFYSRDYYLLARDRLTPEGMFIQWVPLHLPRRVYESVLHTFSTSFPHASLWVLPDRDTFLVGSLRPLAPDWALVSARLAEHSAPDSGAHPYAGLRKHGVTTAAALAAMYVAERGALLAATRHAPVNTLDRPHVEFYAFADYTRSINEMIADNYELLLMLRDTAAIPAHAEASHRALSLYLRALRGAYGQDQDAAAIDELLAESLRLAPDSELLRKLALSYYATRVTARLRAGDTASARRYLAAARELDGGGAEAYRLAALLALHGGDQAGAVSELRRAVRLAPGDVALHTSLFRLLWQSGAVDEAVHHLEAVLEVAPDSVFANRNLGLYLARRRGAAGAALPYLERAYAHTPRDAELIGALAWARYETGDRAAAREVVRSGGRYYRARPELAAERARILDS